MNEEILQINTIIKDLDILLRKIDKRISWVDYIPKELFDTQAQENKAARDMVVIGYKDGRTKYADVTGSSPFHMVRDVCNALDDFCVEKQFMKQSQLDSISENLKKIAITRTQNSSTILELIQLLSQDSITKLYAFAQTKGNIPAPYPAGAIRKEDMPSVLSEYIKTDRFSFIDTLSILQEAKNLMEKEKILSEEMERE